jgi:choice-of-anchor C domain-containing protein
VGPSLLAACVLVALVVSGTPVYAEPILINGSFELGPPPFGNHDIDIPGGSTAITGWLVTGGGIDLNEDPWDVSDGIRAVDLDGRDALNGGIQQTFATVIGQMYAVSFDLSGNPGDHPSNGLPRVKEVRVSVDGFSQDYSHDSGGQSITSLIWQSLGFSFIASSTSATLSFMSLTPFPNSYGALIDNVRVEAVPEPTTIRLVALGILTLLPSLRRRP